jgi:thioredoxin-like negative regulator of GroEL
MKTFANQLDTVEVCTDDLPDVCADAGVASIPTIQMYYRGKLMDTIVGCVAKSVLSSAVEKVMEDAAVQFGVGKEARAEDQQQDS